MIRGQTTDAGFTETEKAAAADQSMNEQINLNLVEETVGQSWSIKMAKKTNKHPIYAFQGNYNCSVLRR